MSAKQNFSLPRSRVLTAFCLLLGFAPLLWPSHLRAESLEDAAHELAMKVCVTARKQPVRVHWRESAESSGYLTDARKKIFLDQISACGIEPAENSDAPVLNVSIRVTASRALLIADSSDAVGSRQTYMVVVLRASLFVGIETSPSPQLRSELLWQQERPIQSAVEWQDEATEGHFLFLLSEGLFIRSRFENGAWRVMDSTELQPASRRSRLEEDFFVYSQPKEKLELVFHQKLCDFNPSGHVSLACSQTNFVGKVVELSSTCEDYPRYLLTGKGDYTQLDRIILARLVGKEASASQEDNYSGSVDMPGPVIDISVSENLKAASAVVKNLSTGNYEVYRITAVCKN